MSVADMKDFETLATSCADQVANLFGLKMMTLFMEDPSLFEGRSTRAEWCQQVDDAEQCMADAIRFEILQAIEQAESRLHDGEFLQSAKLRELW